MARSMGTPCAGVESPQCHAQVECSRNIPQNTRRDAKRMANAVMARPALIGIRWMVAVHAKTRCLTARWSLSCVVAAMSRTTLDRAR